MLKLTAHHRQLTAGAFVGMVGIYSALLASSWSDIYVETHRQPAAVGVSVNVAENEYNALAEELSAKEQELQKREAALNAFPSGTPIEGPSNAIVYTTLVGLILLTLILMNFYLDYRRRGPAW